MANLVPMSGSKPGSRYYSMARHERPRRGIGLTLSDAAVAALGRLARAAKKSRSRFIEDLLIELASQPAPLASEIKDLKPIAKRRRVGA